MGTKHLQKLKEYKYFRIFGPNKSITTGLQAGVFNYMLYLANTGVFSEEDAKQYRIYCQEIDKKLPKPPQYQEERKVISAFKSEAFDEIMEFMDPIIDMLEKYDRAYYVVLFKKINGTIVYEDSMQVAIEISDYQEIGYQEFDPTHVVDGYSDDASFDDKE